MPLPKKKIPNHQLEDVPSKSALLSTPNQITTMTIGIGMSVIPTQEYMDLKQENANLKQEITILKGNADALRQANESHLKTIELLKEENQQLKHIISELKHELKIHLERINQQDLQIKGQDLRIKDQDIQIKDLKEHIKGQDLQIKDLKEHIKGQDLQMKDLNEYITKSKDQKLASRISIAIQDMNSRYQLEKNKSSYTRLLSKLQKNRNGDCHYIEADDPEDLIAYKEQLLCQKLQDLSPTFVHKYETKLRGHGFIQYAISHINPESYDGLDEDLKEEADSWWMD